MTLEDYLEKTNHQCSFYCQDGWHYSPALSNEGESEKDLIEYWKDTTFLKGVEMKLFLSREADINIIRQEIINNLKLVFPFDLLEENFFDHAPVMWVMLLRNKKKEIQK